MPLPGPTLFLLAAIALAGLAACTAAWRRPARLARRASRCRCGYPFAGLVTPTCPECGRPHDHSHRRNRADTIVLALALWTLGALALTWSTAVLLPAVVPPLLTLNCRYNAPSTAGDIRFEWTVFDSGRDPRVTGLTASSSRPGAPIIALVPADLDHGGATIAAAMTALLAPATTTPDADRARIAADLTNAATTALTGGLPGPPHDSGGTALYGSGLAGTGYAVSRSPRLSAAAPLPFTIPTALLGGTLLALRLIRATKQEGRAPEGAPGL